MAIPVIDFTPSHLNCRNWEYNSHPNADEIRSRCERLANVIRKRPNSFDSFNLAAKDGHRFMFNGIAPTPCPYLAGNFRGDNFPSLALYRVKIDSEPRVGVPPELVQAYMGAFELKFEKALADFVAAINSAGPITSAAVLLVDLVELLCEMLVIFFTIHPYANGNGHAGRLMVWVLLARHGFAPIAWPLHKSPAYGAAIHSFRNGHKRELNEFILQSVIGP